MRITLNDQAVVALCDAEKMLRLFEQGLPIKVIWRTRKNRDSIDDIPNMYALNRILKEIAMGGRSVGMVLFPPSAFMEISSLQCLVIGSLTFGNWEQCEYTPAPDIMYTKGQHAPIMAIREYAEISAEVREKLGPKLFPVCKKITNCIEAVKAFVYY